MLIPLANNWGLLLLRGVLSIAFGLMALFVPAITLAALILLFGAYAFADGVLAVITAIGGRGRRGFWSLLLGGIAGIAAGVVTFLYPGLTAITLLLIVAWWAIFSGAMAIAHDPLLVLLDEPTDGLDPVQRDAMLQLIVRIGHEFDMSVVLSSHLLDEVERTCDRVLMLAGGRVAVAGTLDDVRGTAQGLRVEVVGDPSPLVAALDAVDITTSVDRTRVTVEAGGRTADELTREVRDALARSGVALRRLQPQVANLEDLFVAADGEDP